MPDEKPQIVKEIEEDQKKEGRTEEEVFDPMLNQAHQLPASIKGSEGSKQHVYDVGASPEDSPGSVSEAGPDDEEFGGITDPSTLTAD